MTMRTDAEDAGMTRRGFLARTLLLGGLTLGVPARVYQVYRSRTPDQEESVRLLARRVPSGRGSITDCYGELLAGTRSSRGRQQRIYPFGESLANVIGVADASVGQIGLESFLSAYDFDAEPGWAERVLLGNRAFSVSPAPDIQLTLDARMQQQVYALLKGRGIPAAAVCMRPSGQVLCLASFPSFEPASYLESASYRADVNLQAWSLQKNRCLLPAPIGSTMKPLLCALHWKEFGVAPQVDAECGGGTYHAGRWFGCWAHHGYVSGWRQWLRVSCNVPAVEVASRFGWEDLLRHFTKLGLADTELLGLRCSPGKLRLADDSPAALATVGLGQSVEFTPLALCRAYCALMNRGMLHEARLVDSIGGHEVPQAPAAMVLPPEACRQIQSALRVVVTSGTARNIRHSPFLGKTGTAQPSPTNGWFAWAAPSNAPEIVGVVKLEGAVWQVIHRA
jgi:cell division protein FtsI/penicillin-binding protein 2